MFIPACEPNWFISYQVTKVIEPIQGLQTGIVISCLLDVSSNEQYPFDPSNLVVKVGTFATEGLQIDELRGREDGILSQLFLSLKIKGVFMVAGTAGTHCELDALNECASKPCAHGAACQDRVGDYACYCPPKWAGKNCDTYDSNFRGGIGRANIQVSFILNLVGTCTIYLCI